MPSGETFILFALSVVGDPLPTGDENVFTRYLLMGTSGGRFVALRKNSQSDSAAPCCRGRGLGQDAPEQHATSRP